MVALESIACGTPIVATNVGGMKNIIRNNTMGRIVSDNSPQSLAGKISELLGHPEGEAQHIKTRRDTITDFGWAAIADRVLREYGRLLGD
jgi:D-inositol-3-phosphate glycosyltransferase